MVESIKQYVVSDNQGCQVFFPDIDVCQNALFASPISPVYRSRAIAEDMLNQLHRFDHFPKRIVVININKENACSVLVDGNQFFTFPLGLGSLTFEQSSHESYTAAPMVTEVQALLPKERQFYHSQKLTPALQEHLKKIISEHPEFGQYLQLCIHTSLSRARQPATEKTSETPPPPLRRGKSLHVDIPQTSGTEAAPVQSPTFKTFLRRSSSAFSNLARKSPVAAFTRSTTSGALGSIRNRVSRSSSFFSGLEIRIASFTSKLGTKLTEDGFSVSTREWISSSLQDLQGCYLENPQRHKAQLLKKDLSNVPELKIALPSQITKRKPPKYFERFMNYWRAFSDSHQKTDIRSYSLLFLRCFAKNFP